MSKLICGCGYVGQRVAARWLDAGHSVYAITRNQQRARALQAAGLQAIVADITRPETLVGLPRVNTVLFAVGFDRQGGETIHQVYVEGLRAVLSALSPPPDRFIYISSTGVHGQCDGSWVDENSACNPARDGSKAHLQAEELLAGHPTGVQHIVLRLAGIYGPGRVPRRRDLEREGPLPVSDGFLNLIHVDDAAEVVLAAEELAATPSTFLVADGHPVTRRAVLSGTCEIIGPGTA